VKNNVADISAKEGIQETAGLLLLLSSIVLPVYLFFSNTEWNGVGFIRCETS
jgi:hypothetical protein